ncbi:MAG TPA: hypothetical protein VNI57_09335, partial [Candidatus Saccharimonadales bacterium]|nr:hypothetical protein [Candidatus Saccharimonadales bacterium]
MDPASFHRAANDWLKEFAVCLKNVSMYSPKHPRGREALERSREMLESLFEERPSLTLTCHEGRLSLENVSVERDRTVAPRIVSDLAARGIRSVEFSAGFGVREYTALVRALLTGPERLAEKGGMDAVLLDEGVSRIAVNRVRSAKGT